jgi:hypothetical protein
LNIQYFCFGGFVCQGMNHLFLNFGNILLACLLSICPAGLMLPGLTKIMRGAWMGQKWSVKFVKVR